MRPFVAPSAFCPELVQLLVAQFQPQSGDLISAAAPFAYRAVYVLVLLIVFWTAWLVVAGTQIIRTVGDMARFGSVLFQILAPFQLALVIFLAAFGVAGAVREKEPRPDSPVDDASDNSELVLGKLFASLLDLFVMLAASLPLFMLATLFGAYRSTRSPA